MLLLSFSIVLYSTIRRMEKLVSNAVSLTTDQASTNQVDMNHKFVTFKVVYDFFVL